MISIHSPISEGVSCRAYNLHFLGLQPLVTLECSGKLQMQHLINLLKRGKHNLKKRRKAAKIYQQTLNILRSEQQDIQQDFTS